MNIITDGKRNNRRKTALIKRHAAALRIAREEVLKRASLVLDQRQVPFCLWKGMDYAYSLYDDPDERPMGDIDLLIPLSCASPAWNGLSEGGFSCAGYSRELFCSGTSGEAKFVLAGVLLELHTHPLYYPCHLPGSIKLPGSLSCRRSVQGYMAPDWDETLLYTALHHVDAEHLNRRQLEDIRLLAERLDDQGWRKFCAGAAGSGWGMTIGELLIRCGVSAPSECTADLASGTRSRRCGTLGALMRLTGRKRRILVRAMLHKTLTGLKHRGRN